MPNKDVNNVEMCNGSMMLIPLDDGVTKLARPPSTFINIEVLPNVEYLDILYPTTPKGYVSLATLTMQVKDLSLLIPVSAK